MSEHALKCARKTTLILVYCFEMAYSCCFGLRGELDFPDFLQKSFVISTTGTNVEGNGKSSLATKKLSRWRKGKLFLYFTNGLTQLCRILKPYLGMSQLYFNVIVEKLYYQTGARSVIFFIMLKFTNKFTNIPRLAALWKKEMNIRTIPVVNKLLN